MPLRIGPAGSGGLGSEAGIREAARLGLQAYEVEFVYGVRLGNAGARRLGALARELGVSLSVHAPYWINLASKERPKVTASRRRILASAERAHHLGASPVVFHAAFNQGRGPREMFALVREQLLALGRAVRRRGWKTKLAPEVSGRPSQFGSLEELLKLRRRTGCAFCVDFAHLFAREQGRVDFGAVCRQLRRLGNIPLHGHFAGIDFGPKGERAHRPLTPRFFRPLAEGLARFPLDLTLICESPDPFGDAVKLKRWWKKYR